MIEIRLLFISANKTKTWPKHCRPQLISVFLYIICQLHTILLFICVANNQKIAIWIAKNIYKLLKEITEVVSWEN